MPLYRLYFNRRGELPWSVDDGTQATEQMVCEVAAGPGCTVATHYTGEPVNDGSPVAWLVIEAADLSIVSGRAYFTGRLTP